MKTLKLIRNELFKLCKKVSVIVIACIFAVMCFLTPFFDKMSENLFSYDDDFTNHIEWREEYLNELESGSENISYMEEGRRLTEIMYTETDIEDMKFAQGCGVRTGEWRYEIYSEYSGTHRQLVTVNAYIEADPVKVPYLDYITDEDGYPSEEDYDEAKLNSLAASLNTKLAFLEKVIREKDYLYYIGTLKSQMKQSNAMYQAAYAKLGGAIAISEQNRDLTYDSVNAWYNAAASELAVKAYEAMEKTLKANPSDTCVEGNAALNTIITNPYSTFSEYEEYYEAYEDKRMSYEEYAKKSVQAAQEIFDRAKVLIYAEENGKADYAAAGLSRSKIADFSTVYIFISIFGIFLAAGIVSNEYSSKTFNLLLIRPVKRSKVLLSKFAALMIVCIVMCMACLLLWTLSAGIAYGFGDMLEPYMYLSGSSVSEIPFPLYAAGQFALCFVTVITTVTAAFAFSTLTKNTALSAIFGEGVLLGGMLLHTIFDSLLSIVYIPFYGYTPIPYISTVSYTFAEKSDSIDMFFYPLDKLMTGVDYRILYGVVLMVLISIAVYFLTDMVFRKRDVK